MNEETIYNFNSIKLFNSTLSLKLEESLHNLHLEKNSKQEVQHHLTIFCLFCCTCMVCAFLKTFLCLEYFSMELCVLTKHEILSKWNPKTRNARVCGI